MVKEGYKQPEIGLIPENWVLTPLEKISAFITKGSTPTTYGFSWVQDGVLFLRSECVSENGLDLSQSMFISHKAHAVLSRSELRSGDILITITGNVGRVVHLSDDFGIGNMNQHIARVRITSGGINSGFVYHFLTQNSVRKAFNTITTGQAYPQISLKQVRESIVPLPSLPEQRSISQALSDVDALIASLEKAIAKKRHLKTATMQQLLTGKTRLPGFGEGKGYKESAIGVIPEDWETSELIEKASVIDSLHKTPDFCGDGYPMVRVADIKPGDLRLHETLKVCDSVFEEFTRNYQPKRGDIVLSRVGSYGISSFVETDEPFCLGQNTVVIESRVPPRFLYYALNSEYIREQIEDESYGSGYKSLSLKNIKELIFAIPSVSEQQEIATVLSDMDAAIAALETRRAKTQALKQGMMQQLLTGKVRLKIEA